MCDIVPSNIIVAGVACGVDCGRTRVGLCVSIKSFIIINSCFVLLVYEKVCYNVITKLLMYIRRVF